MSPEDLGAQVLAIRPVDDALTPIGGMQIWFEQARVRRKVGDAAERDWVEMMQESHAYCTAVEGSCTEQANQSLDAVAQQRLQLVTVYGQASQMSVGYAKLEDDAQAYQMNM